MSICEDCDGHPSLLAELAPLLITLIFVFGGLWLVAGKIDPQMNTWTTLNMVIGVGGFLCCVFFAWEANARNNDVARFLLFVLIALEILWWALQGARWLFTYTHITFG